MQEEQDTCRICSGPAEPDQPLFYPCKCSGTIRYIHQDCLTTWLAHSKKQTCDVCKHPYAFTKVYSKDMPKTLPPWLLVRQIFRQLISTLFLGIRSIVVGTMWLAVLPWVTIWTWRLYFAMGDFIAWMLSDLPRPHELGGFSIVARNMTSLSSNSTAANATSPQSLLSHPVVRAVSSDIVAGQIVASMIVLVFVAVFLLREWISQNARPGVFEDAEGIDEPPQPAVPEQEAAQQPPEIPRLPDPAQPVREDDGVWQRVWLNNTRNPPVPDQPVPGDSHEKTDKSDEAANRSPHKRVRRMDDESTARQSGVTRREKGKRVEHRDRHGLRYRPDHWRRTSEQSVTIGSDIDEEDFIAEWRAREETRLRQFRWPEQPSTSSLNLPSEQTQFTFRAPTIEQSTVATSEDDSMAADSVTEQSQFTFAPPILRSTSDIPTDIAERSFPHSWHSADAPSPQSSTSTKVEDSLSAAQPLLDSIEEFSFTRIPSLPTPPAETPGNLRRPPLPSVTLPPSLGASPSASASRSRSDTPPASPSLATYRAPEEFEAGPSKLSGYFHDDTLSENGKADMEADSQLYFANPIKQGDAEEEEVDAGGPEADDEGEVYRWSDHDPQDADEEWDAEAMGVEIRDLREVMEEDRLLAERMAAPGARNLVFFDRQPRPPRPPRPNDEVDVNENEMDGAMEAIGLRGPLLIVLQNATLVTFILDASIGVGVWLPFTLGKCTALLSLNPRRSVQILQLPLRLIRLVTDPVVDFIILWIRQSFFPWAVDLASIGLQRADNVLASAVGHERATQISESCQHMFRYISDTAAREAQARTSTSFLVRMLEDHSDTLRRIELVFAPIGKAMRTQYNEGKFIWLRLATGNGTPEKVFATVLGYSVLGLLIAIYLNILNIASVRSAGRAVRSAVRQQLIVVKVASFIIVELVIFPLGCGVMLDLSATWLMPQGDMRDRLAFLRLAPITTTFYHWVMGTMFMYHFAVLLAGCRAIMRPGSMWFIKDPQDQNFHPIRDILERPTLVQVRKLLVSAVMYGFVVSASVGTVSGVLRLFSGTVLPFRWRIREPLSNVPIDLLFLHFALPYTMHYFRPKKVLREFGIYLWKYLSRQLRLTSYMFGDRYPSEEFTPNHWSWRMLVMTSEIQMDDAEAVHDGSFWRVPNSDNVVIAKDVPATAEVNENGLPLGEEQAASIAVQDAEAEKAKRSIKTDYTVAYIPPHFRYRIAAFIVCVWTIGSMMLALTLALPILLGRSFFKLFISREVHDGYSFITGFYLLWSCWLVANAIDRLDKRRQRRGGDEPRAEWPLYLAKRSLLWIAKTSYMAVFLGFVIPTLFALVIEFYTVQPLRHMLHPVQEVRIRIVDMWATGLLFTQIFLRTMRAEPTSRIITGIEQIRRNGWTHPDPIKATQDVIFPVTLGLLGALLMPPGALWGLRQVLSLPIGDNFLFVHLYPSLFTAAGLSHGALLLSKVVASWSQSIRDKEFLVEMRLRNLEPQQEQKPEPAPIVEGVEEEEEEY
ncbi:hypothetical protein SCP_0904900 [Sparassis crispa]|uniref:RING-type E3 ubiquitin transferase n=1 Tax=Sparassis crispa TaxID=139825 RepID=A0A401GWM0_9APHY|nr:hypothetical protein SCP_0904900 [Sparassis crispa]GBE86611.1 hypothetical protein SCP_0904900 [Sparassis crispa]